MTRANLPPPVPLNYLSPPPAAGPARPLALVAMAGTTVVAGAAVGAATNAVNGAVSPDYFVAILRWHHVADVWRASIAQGIFEGLLFGLGFALVFTLTVGIVARGACPYALALRCLVGIVGGALACWALGGLLGMGLASLSPEFFRHSFLYVPAGRGPMLRYAWVGGSIWGVQFGGVLSLVVGLVLLRARWKRALPGGREAVAFGEVSR